MELQSTKWFFDEINPHLLQLHAIESALYSGRTKFQSIEILKSPSFGKLLVLDGKIQSSEADEFVYHELLVHPPMLAHPILKRFSLPAAVKALLCVKSSPTPRSKKR